MWNDVLNNKSCDLKLTQCTEDDRPTSIFFTCSDGSDKELVLSVSPQAAQRDRFAIPCDHRHHPVTNRLAIVFRFLPLLSW